MWASSCWVAMTRWLQGTPKVPSVCCSSTWRGSPGPGRQHGQSTNKAGSGQALDGPPTPLSFRPRLSACTLSCTPPPGRQGPFYRTNHAPTPACLLASVGESGCMSRPVLGRSTVHGEEASPRRPTLLTQASLDRGPVGAGHTTWLPRGSESRQPKPPAGLGQPSKANNVATQGATQGDH